jgi:hypothetical protein
MQERSLTIPELILLAGTRIVLGAGVGLLIGDRLARDARKRGRVRPAGSWRP